MRLLKSKLRECNNERKKALEVLRKHVPNEAPKNICSFVPRMYDYHPQSIPAPYNHSNIDSEGDASSI